MNARNDLAEAEVEFNASKAALFREFPEMAPKAPAAAETPVTPPTPQPATPEPVPSPQGGLVFREMDDDYDPFAGG